MENKYSFLILLIIIVIDIILSFILPKLNNFTSVAIILSIFLWINFICIFYSFS